MQQTDQVVRVAELGRRFVTNGSTTCPHPAFCDQAMGQTYEDYVRQHCQDHKLGGFGDLDDAERNLGVNCLFFLARHVLGNLSLGTGDRIVAHWEPCWEDAEYLANWRFAPSDTEQDVDWEQRTFKLLPYAERDHAAAVYKRFKKLTKVRDTQKSSWGKAYVTFRQLRAYYVEDRPNFRVLVISGTSPLARNHYLAPLSELWEHSEGLQRLYGDVTYTKRYHQLKARADAGKDVDPDELEAETRRIGLLARGSRPTDTLRMRWIIRNKKTSGLSAISLMVAGMTTTTTGNRWDLVMVDDPVTPENIGTETQRRKVKGKIADLRKQGDADSEFVYLNTPYHLDDASSTIDREQGHQYHILYRPGYWVDTATHQPCFYWSYNALDPGSPEKGKRPRNAVWPPDRIEEDRGQPDFVSQVLLRAQDPTKALFLDTDFPVVQPTMAPPEVTIGLGRPATPEELEMLRADGVEIRGYVLIDPAGNDEKTAKGDDTFIVAIRIDRFGGMWVVRMACGQLNPSEEAAAAYEAWVYAAANTIEYELSSSGKKWVKKGYAEFQAKRSMELQRPVAMPIYWRDAAGAKSKYWRIPQMHPFIKAGRLKILANAAPQPLIAKYKAQWTGWGQEPHDDGPDATSRIMYYIDVTSQYVAPEQTEPVEQIEFRDGVLSFPAQFIFDAMAAHEKGSQDRGWGQKG